MAGVELDHLVVTAPDLASGIDFVERRLGCSMLPGGHHDRMGTHNALLRVGPRAYLEVISVAPGAPAGLRPRWFGLDDLRSGDAPRLATWVVRTPRIAVDAAALGPLVGPVEAMSRGALSWQITIPADGSLPLGGVLPSLIQWDAAPHPAIRLPTGPVTLVRLTARGAGAGDVLRRLQGLGFRGEVGLEFTEGLPEQGLQAVFQTATGDEIVL